MKVISKRNRLHKKESYSNNQIYPRIGSYNEAPHFTLDNKYLLTGYRINYNTPLLAFKSLFHLHNETCNIWSHLLPLILCIIILTYSFWFQSAPFIFLLKDNPSNHIELWPLRYCLICGSILFIISSIYHTFFCVSNNASCILLRFDYAGICLIASGGIIPVIQYGFYCNYELKQLYTWISVLLCTLTFLGSLYDFMHKEHFVIFKSLIYVTFFTFLFIPVFHLIIYSRLNLLGEHFHVQDSEQYFIYCVIFLITGISTYATRFPEKYFPKKFDIFINSHTIWHIFVVLSYTMGYMVGLSMYSIREHYDCQ